jgi:hypothetical protein
MMARMHIVITPELVEEIDRVAGERGRSRFLEEAAREKLDRIELAKALRATKGIAKGPGYRHWRNRQAAAEWVEHTRRSGDGA